MSCFLHLRIHLLYLRWVCHFPTVAQYRQTKHSLCLHVISRNTAETKTLLYFTPGLFTLNKTKVAWLISSSAQRLRGPKKLFVYLHKSFGCCSSCRVNCWQLFFFLSLLLLFFLNLLGLTHRHNLLSWRISASLLTFRSSQKYCN